jgi:DNA-binding NarL/FixJ family response regulator
MATQVEPCGASFSKDIAETSSVSEAVAFLHWLNQTDRMHQISNALALFSDGDVERAVQCIHALRNSGALTQLANMLLLSFFLSPDQKERKMQSTGLAAANHQGVTALASESRPKRDLTLRIGQRQLVVLSLKQRLVLKFVREGMTNKQIAEQMAVSLNTVKWHMKNISRVLGAKNRCSILRIVGKEEIL